MILVRGKAQGTDLTGTVFEPEDDAPSYDGAPDVSAPYVWVCDSFYEVESGGTALFLEDRTVRIAFESPAPRGFETEDAAVEAAREHVRTQFARIGVSGDDVTVEVERSPRTE
ncbi:MAG: DUF7113 family protein [Halobacteria archaeon]